MTQRLWQAYLYDFYGELLNEHQRRVYEDFHFNDLSLGEIAEQAGISRQGVADMVRRSDRKLAGYEDKLHLVEKFLAIAEDAQQIEALADDLREAESHYIARKPHMDDRPQGAMLGIDSSRTGHTDGDESQPMSIEDTLDEVTRLARHIIEEL